MSSLNNVTIISHHSSASPRFQHPRNGITSCSSIAFFWWRWKELKLRKRIETFFLLFVVVFFFIVLHYSARRRKLSSWKGKRRRKEKTRIVDSGGSMNLSHPLIRRLVGFFFLFASPSEILWKWWNFFHCFRIRRSHRIRGLFFPRDSRFEFILFLWKQSATDKIRKS